jgi:hypothetical protein
MDCSLFAPQLKLLLLTALLFAATGARANCSQDRKQYDLGNRQFHAQQYLLAAIQFSQVSLSDCDSTIADKAKYAYALAMAELGEMEIAIETLKSLAGSTLDQTSKLYLTYLDNSFAKDLSRHDRSRIQLWQSRGSTAAFQNAATTYETHEVEKNRLLKMQELLTLAPSRSPVVAGIASALIPGLGQAYVGSWQAAGIALVLNALFLATTVELARHDLWAASAASGLVFSVTYIGNILNAIAAAETVNQVQSAPYERELKQKLFPEFSP